MPLATTGAQLVGFDYAEVGMAALLVAAATTDVLTRRIPNSLVVAVAIVGVAIGVTGGLRGAAYSIGAALLVFPLLVALWQGSVLGGGDVKLTTAAAFGIGLNGLATFLAVTAVAGGFVAAGAWIVRRSGDWTGPVARPERTGRSRKFVPYGVAIAAGAIWTLMLS